MPGALSESAPAPANPHSGYAGADRETMEGRVMASDGVQMVVPGVLTPDELREERRREYRAMGIVRMERAGRSVLVGKRRVKAWRVAGTPEFTEHARLVACCAEAFSREVHRLGREWADADVTVRFSG